MTGIVDMLASGDLPEGATDMIRATTLHDIRALLGQMLDIEDLDVLVNESMFRIVYKPLADICSLVAVPSPGRRDTFGGPQILATVRPGETMREDVGTVSADAQSIVRLCEIWAARVGNERDAIQAMKPLMEAQQREAECYARLAHLPDRMRTPEEAADFAERLGELEERLGQHIAETVPDPVQRAAKSEELHGGIQTLERRSALVGVRRSLALVWVFLMTFVGDATKVSTLIEHLGKLKKLLLP